MIVARGAHLRFDVKADGADGRVARSRQVGDLDLVDRNAGTDADSSGVGRLAAALRAGVGVCLALEADFAGSRSHVGCIGKRSLRARLRDVEAERAGDGDRVATFAVVIGGLGLGIAGVAGFGALAGTGCPLAVRVAQLIVGFAVDVLVRAVVALALRALGAGVGF